MATVTTTTNVFSPAPEIQQKLDALVSDLMSLGSSNLAMESPARQIQGLATFAPVKIMGADKGVVLDGGVVVPLGAGPFPVVVLPGPLAEQGWKSYPGALIRLAATGYIAVAYTERGLGDSTSMAQVAGEADVRDGSSVIDWVLANYPQADPTRVGFMGTSYGAGMSLLIAAKDSRVSAVAALSAWGDLGESLLENRTPHIKAADALAKVFGERLSSEAKQILEDFRKNIITEAFHKFSHERSPRTYLAQLNQRDVPILMSTYWHETIFSVPAVVSLFNDLTGPKRLLAQVGDHSCDEILGFAGLPSRATETAYKWLDTHVKHRGRSWDEDTTVHAETMFMNVVTEVQKVASWTAYAQPPVKYFLDAPAAGNRDGVMSTTQGAGGTQDFIGGVDTPATVAPMLIITGAAERLGLPQTYATSTMSRENAIVWSSPAFNTAQQIAGAMTLHLTVTPSSKDALVIAHLFDLDPRNNAARIITSAPFTLGDANARQVIDIPLHPAGYRLEAGHQLQLVVDSKDPMYYDVYDRPSKITVSTVNGGSYLNLPIKPVQ